jgi:hypothetical protein
MYIIEDTEGHWKYAHNCNITKNTEINIYYGNICKGFNAVPETLLKNSTYTVSVVFICSDKTSLSQPYANILPM